MSETRSSDRHGPGFRRLAPLVLVTTVGPFAMQIFLPALAQVRADFAVSAAGAQLTVSLALLTFGLAMLVWGPVSDRLGRRGPMIAGMSLFLVGGVVCLLATNLPLLVAGRMLSAAGGAAGMVLTRAMVRDITPPERVAAAISQLTVGQIVPPMMAPALGGLLVEAFGWRSVFLALTAMGVLALVLLLRLPETHRERTSGAGLGGLLGGFAQLLRRTEFNAFAVFAALSMGGYFAFIAEAPLLAVGALGLSPAVYGLAFITVSGSFLVGNALSAAVSTRLGPRRMVGLGALVALAGTAGGLAWALLAPLSAWSLFLPTMVLALGNGLSLNNAQAGAMAVVPRAAGAAAGLVGFLQMAAGALITQGVGALHDGTALPVYAVMAGSGALGLAAFALLGGRQR